MSGSRTPLRGRKGWERREAERPVDLPAGSKPPAPTAPSAPSRPTPASKPGAAATPGSTRRAGPGRRLPNLAGLPPLLAGSGGFAALRERLGPIAEPATSAGRHAGVTSVPHGAKSYLTAALALVAGERICWVARDSEIGDRVAEELAAWGVDADMR
jgi:hypothetical protein